MPSTLTPNMQLIAPTVGLQLGPTWAQNINADLSTIDKHDHAAGNGVPVTPAGLNISSDLSFLSNNAIALRSSRYIAQASPLSGPLDLDCTYVSGVDLYYNDGNGNQIQITASGGVAGSPGSIGSLTPPASVTYVSANKTYVFQSDVNTAGGIDAGPITIRQILANAHGITIQSPNSLAADYSLTLPAALPSALSLMTLDNTGNIGVLGPLSALALPGSLSVASTLHVVGGIQADSGITIGAGGPGITNSGSVLFLPNTGVALGSGGAELVPGGNKTIQIADNVGASARPIVVSFNPNTSGLIICRGTVNSNGSVAGGEGFSVGIISSTYTITFNTVFVDVPAVTCTAVGANQVVISAISVSSVSFQFYALGTSSPQVLSEFSFIAIGQRST